MGILVSIIGVIGNVISLLNPFFATLFVAVMAFYRPSERFTLFYPIVPITILISLVVVFIYNKKKALDDDMELKLLAILVFYIAVTYATFFRWAPEASMHNLKITLVVPITLFLLTSKFITSIKRMLVFSSAMVISSLLVCGDALYVHFMLPNYSSLWAAYHHGSRLMGWGWWSNANELAFISNLGLGFLVLIFLVKKNFFIRLSVGSISIVFLVTNFLTGSRAGVLQLLVFLSTLLLFTKKKIVAILLVSVILISMLFVLIKLKPRRKDEVASSNARRDLLYEARQSFYRNPIFGVGFKVFRFGGQVAHNTYMEALVEFGILGSYIFFRMLYLCYSKIFVLMKKIKKKRGLSELYTLAFCYFSLLVAAGVYFFFGNQLLSFPFLTLMGVAVAVPRIYHSEIINLERIQKKKGTANKDVSWSSRSI